VEMEDPLISSVSRQYVELLLILFRISMVTKQPLPPQYKNIIFSKEVEMSLTKGADQSWKTPFPLPRIISSLQYKMNVLNCWLKPEFPKVCQVHALQLLSFTFKGLSQQTNKITKDKFFETIVFCGILGSILDLFLCSPSSSSSPSLTKKNNNNNNNIMHLLVVEIISYIFQNKCVVLIEDLMDVHQIVQKLADILWRWRIEIGISQKVPLFRLCGEGDQLPEPNFPTESLFHYLTVGRILNKSARLWPKFSEIPSWIEMDALGFFNPPPLSEKTLPNEFFRRAKQQRDKMQDIDELKQKLQIKEMEAQILALEAEKLRNSRA